ncbi:hypothetical protein SDIAM103S_02662 [Streptomyces diastaticus subsp. diastaticus]
MPAPGGGFAQPGGARCPRGGPRARARVRCGATGFLSAGARGVAGPSARGSGCGGGCGGACGGAPPPVRRGASRAAGAGTLGAGLRAGHPGAGAGHPGERAGCGTGPSPPAAVRPGPGSVAGTVPWGLAAPRGGAGPGGGRRAGGGAGPLAYRSWSLICRWHRPCSCHRLLPWCLRPAVVPACCRAWAAAWLGGGGAVVAGPAVAPSGPSPRSSTPARPPAVPRRRRVPPSPDGACRERDTGARVGGPRAARAPLPHALRWCRVRTADPVLRRPFFDGSRSRPRCPLVPPPGDPAGGRTPVTAPAHLAAPPGREVGGAEQRTTEDRSASGRRTVTRAPGRERADAGRGRGDGGGAAVPGTVSRCGRRRRDPPPLPTLGKRTVMQSKGRGGARGVNGSAVHSRERIVGLYAALSWLGRNPPVRP